MPDHVCGPACTHGATSEAQAEIAEDFRAARRGFLRDALGAGAGVGGGALAAAGLGVSMAPAAFAQSALASARRPNHYDVPASEKTVPVDHRTVKENHGVLKNVHLPVRPHFGTLALAPAEAEFVNSIPPSYPNYLADLGADAQNAVFGKSSLDLAMRDAYRKNAPLPDGDAGPDRGRGPISLMSIAVDLGIAQGVDGNWGVHAVVRRASFPAAAPERERGGRRGAPPYATQRINIA